MKKACLAFLALAAAGAVWWLVVKSRESGRSGGSFWDVVRNPDAVPDFDEIDRQIKSEAAAIGKSPESISRLVDYFVFEAKSARDAWGERRLLGELGDKTYPRALAILRDSALQPQLVALRAADDSELPEAPINRLCELFDLEAPPPPGAVELLAPFLSSDSDGIRKSVALVIASTGSETAVPHIEKSLHDPEEYVRSYALMGMQRALKGERIGPATRSRLFEMVASMWPADTAFATGDGIPDVLLQLDRERAIARLSEPDVLTAEFEPVWRALEAFRNHSVVIPREKLLPIIAAAAVEPLEYPKPSILGEALACLGACRDPQDLPVLERYLEHADGSVAAGAVNGIYAWRRYKETVRDPYDAGQALGWDRLTPAEKHLLSIRMLDAEVNNGGFAQFFFNSSGDRWPEALAGLEAAGAEQHAALLRAVLERFPGGQPATGRDKRQDELSKIARKREDPFHAQDEAWYALPDGLLERLLMKYDLAHLEGRSKTE